MTIKDGSPSAGKGLEVVPPAWKQPNVADIPEQQARLWLPTEACSIE